ncbi:MAG TPA: asparagine--tRNA ligase [Flavobacteriales bacterium]|nr:asparagine--tRNA ligase [Flavobacteriales bacterium]
MFEATTLNLLKIPLKSLENKDKIKYKNIFIDIEKKYIEDIEKLGYINDITESLKHINFKDITIKELLTRNPEEIIKNTYNDYIKSNFSDHFFEIANEKSFKSLINKLKDELNEKLLKEKVKIEFNKRKYNKSKHPYLYYNIYNILNPKLKKVEDKQDFFGKPTNLTVSGQLEAELAALALSKVYTFGPTFRAENSNTTRHLAEFWMIEPEIAFADLDDDMDLAEDLLKYCIGYVLENCKDDLQFLSKRQQDEEKQKPQNERSMELFEKLNFILKEPFERLTYTEAIEILRNSKPNKKGKFQYPVEGFGTDLQSEHERYLVEKHFKKPVILTDYPAEIKAFYMRLNEDGKTVRAMDILFPGIGEIVGGSQREERYEVLLEKVKQFNIPEEELWWYLDTRKFGTAPHSGFGLGFERLVQFVTGMGNIRDVIPFPRTPKNAEF